MKDYSRFNKWTHWAKRCIETLPCPVMSERASCHIVVDALTGEEVRGLIEAVDTADRNLLDLFRSHLGWTEEVERYVDVFWEKHAALDCLQSVVFWETYDTWGSEEFEGFLFLWIQRGYSLMDAAEGADTVEILEGYTPTQYVESLIEDGAFPMETLLAYIDTEALARDRELGGDIETFGDDLILNPTEV